MNKNNKVERIENYLLGRMSEEGKKAFETELEKDKELAQLYAKQKFEHQAMEVLIEKDLKKDLNLWEDQKKSTLRHPGKSHEGYHRSMIVVIVLLLILLGYAIIISQFNAVDRNSQRESESETVSKEYAIAKDDSPRTEEDLSSEELDPDEGDIIQFSQDTDHISQVDLKTQLTNEEAEEMITSPSAEILALASRYDESMDFEWVTRSNQSPLDKAIGLLGQGNLDRGIVQLDEIVLKDSSNLNAIYYLGLAHYENDAFAVALPYLQQISDSLYLNTERAQWFMVLAYLHLNEVENARKIARAINEDAEHSYYNKANSLLSELNNLRH